MDSIFLQILLQVFLIGLNAIFACAEIAVISMDDNKLVRLAEQGDKRAIKLGRLTSQPARFLATIQVAITLSGFMGSAFAAENFSDRLVTGLVKLGVPISESTLDSISVILITLILSYFTLVFGELVPKRVAMNNAEKLALGMSSLISFVSTAFKPIVWFLTASTNGILRLLRIDPNANAEEVSEEEIRMLVDVGNEKGIINEEEKEIIHNVFEFDDMTVNEIATHRTDVVFLDMEDTFEQWDKIIKQNRHSKYPVCRENVDNVIGILSTKDYFRTVHNSKEDAMKESMKPVFYVPESIKADVLFKKMRQNKSHFAVVLDEYGGTMGIITINDLIEQLIGDFDDEVDLSDVEPTITQLEDGKWLVTGNIMLDDVAATMKIELPTEEYETLGGYIFSTYGQIPDDKSKFETDIGQLHVSVLEIKEHCLNKAEISIIPKETTEDSKE